jgi:hypothetical protein
MKELITERDVAKITGLSVATVRRWRVQKTGPYLLDDDEEDLEQPIPWEDILQYLSHRLSNR